MEARPLPRKIKVRLADTRRHYRALVLGLDTVSADEFARAAREGDTESLTRTVYPIERAFEVVVNYVAELVALWLAEAGLPASSGPDDLRRLEAEGVIARARRDNLTRIHRVRNELAHEYPDVRARSVYEAAQLLAAELPGFFREYAAWMRKLGFGQQPSPSA